jgi:hypothetical protein
MIATATPDLLADGAHLPAGAKITTLDGNLRLQLPPGKGVSFKVLIAAGGDAKKDAFASLVKASSKPVDLAPLTKGGPARWTDTVVTQGVVGKEKAPYVVDTLTLPVNNPWKAKMRIGGHDFFSDMTRAALCTWDGDVWIVSGIDASLEKLSWKRYATGLYQPLGLRIVNDQVYAVGHDQITRLHDLNGDGEADFYECLTNNYTTPTGGHDFICDFMVNLLQTGFGTTLSFGAQPGKIHHLAILHRDPPGARNPVMPAEGFVGTKHPDRNNGSGGFDDGQPNPGTCSLQTAIGGACAFWEENDRPARQ